MKHLALALLAPLLLIAARDDAPVLVPDVSQREVEILYSFTGTELLLFGAILYPGGRVPDGRTDVAVVLKGPPQSILVREKEKLAGLVWANAGAARFRSAPAFYAVASSRPLKDLVDDRTAAIYELGLGNIHLSPASGSDPAVAQRFETGFVDLRARGGLFVASPGAVEISRGRVRTLRGNGGRVLAIHLWPCGGTRFGRFWLAGRAGVPQGLNRFFAVRFIYTFSLSNSFGSCEWAFDDGYAARG